MTTKKLHDALRRIVEENLEPASPPYWDDGAAPLSDAACQAIIRAVRRHDKKRKET